MQEQRRHTAGPWRTGLLATQRYHTRQQLPLRMQPHDAC